MAKKKRGRPKKKKNEPPKVRGKHGGAREGAGRKSPEPDKKKIYRTTFVFSKHVDIAKFRAAGYRLLYERDDLFNYIRLMPTETIDLIAKKWKSPVSFIENLCNLLAITINDDRTTTVGEIDIFKPTDHFGRLESEAAPGDGEDV